jgi:hypothetical protein
MRNSLSKIIVVFVVFVPVLTHGALIDSIQAYWNLDETSGARFDSTLNNNDLTDNNTVLYGTGVSGNAADFENANSEYFSIVHANTTGLTLTSPYTISFWFKPESTGNYSTFLEKRTNGGQNGYGFFIQGDTDKTRAINWDASTNNLLNGVTVLTAGTWYYITSVYTGTNLYIYINGVLDSSSSSTLTPTSNTSTFFLGGNYDANGFVDGLMDEVGIWNVALSSDQVALLYNSGTGCFYPFTDDCVASGGSEEGTSTATTASSPYTLSDLSFVSSVIIFLLSFISIGMVFSLLKKNKK